MMTRFNVNIVIEKMRIWSCKHIVQNSDPVITSGTGDSSFSV